MKAQIVAGLACLVALSGAAMPMNAARAADTLNEQQMRDLVAAPLAKAERGDLAGGQQDFEGLLDQRRQQFGADSAQVANTLTAFGVFLFNDACSACGPAQKRAAVAYLQRAIEATRAAFGPGSLEVARALNDCAEVERSVYADRPPLEADEMLAEALRIRLEALGPTDPQTVATVSRVSELESLTARGRADDAQIARVAAILQAAVSAARQRAAEKPDEPAWIYDLTAKFYLKYDRLRPAMANFELFQKECDDFSAVSCGADFPRAEAQFADFLERAGYHAQADALTARLDLVARR